MTRLLETKLHAPHPRASAVDRSRLLDRLRRGTASKLTLVSAPPGFGKTTLVAQWISAVTGPDVATAWVSLDDADNDPATFWAYVVAAVRTGVPGAGSGAEALLEGGERVEVVLASLINDLAAVDGELVVVLDDFHTVEAREVNDGLAFLLDHLPPRVHLVLVTRADPALPLARMRVRGELVEVRAADLRFTPDEAASYLNGAMGLGLTGGDIAALEARTEGWIAALQLAALSMQGRDDAASFVATFAGDDRYVVDYLVDEVLDRQPDDVREFLLRTAILERLTGPLCDAVTGMTGGSAMLEALERRNLFLVPLDDRRRWYRYHHLFGDLLRARAVAQDPGLVPELHRRASAWFEAGGDRSAAIEHALAARDFDRGAGLIERSARELLRARQEVTVRRWLDALPDEVFDVRPVLADAHAGALLSVGTTEGVEGRLDAAERWVAVIADPVSRAEPITTGMVVDDVEALDHLPSSVALHRAGLAIIRGDAAGAVAHAETAFARAGDRHPLERGGAAGILGLAYWGRGDLAAAHAAWTEAVRGLELAHHLPDVLGCSIALADITLAQGRLGDARRVYEHGLALGTRSDPPLRGTADMHTGLGELLLEANELVAARTHLDASVELGDARGLPQNPYRQRVALARLREAEGDRAAALALLDEAERVYAADFFPEVRPVAAVRARAWIADGRANEALAWARSRGLSEGDELSYLREYEHVTLARARLAQARAGSSPAQAQAGSSREGAEAASRFVGRLLEAADDAGRGRSVIELLVLAALARDGAGDREGALASLDRALSLAEPEEYVRIFIDEGPAMAALLRDAARRSPSGAYATRLVDAMDGRPQAPATSRQPMIEPLSERELDVLRLLATDLDGPEIAAQLFVSLNTMRTHTRHIFEKLGVSSRRAAVTRANELRLLGRDR